MTKLRVTVAPGQCVELDPHPSGFPGLGPLVLEAGEVLFAEPDEAEQLFQAGKVLSLVTGRPIEHRLAPTEGRVTIQYGSGPVQDAAALGMVHPDYRAIADAEYNANIASEPPRAAPPRASVRHIGEYAEGGFLSGGSASIQNADGGYGPGF